MKEKLLQQVPLVDFFRERVQSALTNQQVAASEFTEFYLVKLLQEFRKSEKLFEQDGSKIQKKTFAGLYGELSKLFPNLVTVLSEVATTSGWASNQDLLRLYERWLATGNGHLEEMLHKAGILTTDKDPFEKPQ